MRFLLIVFGALYLTACAVVPNERNLHILPPEFQYDPNTDLLTVIAPVNFDVALGWSADVHFAGFDPETLEPSGEHFYVSNHGHELSPHPFVRDVEGFTFLSLVQVKPGTYANVQASLLRHYGSHSYQVYLKDAALPRLAFTGNAGEVVLLPMLTLVEDGSVEQEISFLVGPVDIPLYSAVLQGDTVNEEDYAMLLERHGILPENVRSVTFSETNMDCSLDPISDNSCLPLD